MQDDVHVASPGRIPAQDDVSADGISGTHANWSVEHEQSLLPVCRPEQKPVFLILPYTPTFAACGRDVLRRCLKSILFLYHSQSFRTRIIFTGSFCSTDRLHSVHLDSRANAGRKNLSHCNNDIFIFTQE